MRSVTKINIPLSCPSCSGKMYALRYETPLKILKERGWLVCKECDYEIQTEYFKNRLFTV